MNAPRIPTLAEMLATPYIPAPTADAIRRKHLDAQRVKQQQEARAKILRYLKHHTGKPINANIIAHEAHASHPVVKDLLAVMISQEKAHLIQSSKPGAWYIVTSTEGVQ